MGAIPPKYNAAKNATNQFKQQGSNLGKSIGDARDLITGEEGKKIEINVLKAFFKALQPKTKKNTAVAGENVDTKDTDNQSKKDPKKTE